MLNCINYTMTKFYIHNIINVCVSKENSENNIRVHIANKIQVFVKKESCQKFLYKKNSNLKTT